MKEAIKKYSLDRNSNKYWIFIIFTCLHKNPFLGIFYFTINFIYSLYISNKIFGFSLLPKVCFTNGIFKVNVNIQKDCKINTINGIVILFEKWNAGTSSTIIISQSSVLSLHSYFIIGDGCKISISNGGHLIIKGSDANNESGITCNSIILCSNNIEIGKSVIISWNCYISDSSQHKINGALKLSSVKIGDKVWISEGVSISPGTILGDGIIVGAKAYVSNVYPPGCLIAGQPARVVKNNITWSR
jgi:acetyltransferase-like isoleucine patch superfamily enzyme